MALAVFSVICFLVILITGARIYNRSFHPQLSAEERRIELIRLREERQLAIEAAETPEDFDIADALYAKAYKEITGKKFDGNYVGGF